MPKKTQALHLGPIAGLIGSLKEEDFNDETLKLGYKLKDVLLDCCVKELRDVIPVKNIVKQVWKEMIEKDTSLKDSCKEPRVFGFKCLGNCKEFVETDDDCLNSLVNLFDISSDVYNFILSAVSFREASPYSHNDPLILEDEKEYNSNER